MMLGYEMSTPQGEKFKQARDLIEWFAEGIGSLQDELIRRGNYIRSLEQKIQQLESLKETKNEI